MSKPVRRRTTIWRALIGLSVLLLASLIVSVVLIQFPTTKEPPRVDAIVVLGSLDDANMAQARQLISAGVSDHLVLSVADGEWGTLCHDPPVGLTISCFLPDPSTTRGEAQEIGRLAEEHGWKSLAVVTWTTHVFRSRILISRCFDGDLYMVDYPDQTSFSTKVREQIYQSGAFIKVIAQPSC